MVGTDHKTGNIQWEGKELLIEKVETLGIIIFRVQNSFVALKFKIQVKDLSLFPFWCFKLLPLEFLPYYFRAKIRELRTTVNICATWNRNVSSVLVISKAE